MGFRLAESGLKTVPATVHQYVFDPPELWQLMHAAPTLWLLLSLYAELFDPLPAFSLLQERKQKVKKTKKINRKIIPDFFMIFAIRYFAFRYFANLLYTVLKTHLTGCQDNSIHWGYMYSWHVPKLFEDHRNWMTIRR